MQDLTMPLFFLHNPKAAGTSISSYIRSRIHRAHIAPNIENDVVSHAETRQKLALARGYQAYLGHYGLDVWRAVSDGHTLVTNFRRPAARLVSLYHYFRHTVTPPVSNNQDQFFAVYAAKKMSIQQFLQSDDPRIQIYTTNFHARQLTESCWEPNTSIDVDLALSLIEQMPWYYVCEAPAQSTYWAREFFGDDKLSFPTLNANPRPSKEGPSLQDLADSCDAFIQSGAIEERNHIDQQLWEYAIAKLPERLNAEHEPSQRPRDHAALRLSIRLQNPLSVESR